MQTLREQHTEVGGDDDERTANVSDGQESVVCDSEDAIILTARRVRIVRCCQAKQTTLPSVRSRPAIFHLMQLTETRSSW